MAYIRLPPPSVEQMLADFANWMAQHSQAKVTVRMDYRDGTYSVTEIDRRGPMPKVDAPNAPKLGGFKEIEMRKVMVSSFENIPGTKQYDMIEKGEAVFHQFGTDYEEFENGPGLFPVAIVEFPDGHIETPRAEWVRFLVPNFEGKGQDRAKLKTAPLNRRVRRQSNWRK